jgi:hypothetical protein
MYAAACTMEGCWLLFCIFIDAGAGAAQRALNLEVSKGQAGTAKPKAAHAQVCLCPAVACRRVPVC